jgi:hypothetical protein
MTPDGFDIFLTSVALIEAVGSSLDVGRESEGGSENL